MEHRYSCKREAIYAKLCSVTTHPSAEWVYNELKGQLPGLSLATVYRNLRMFVSMGTAQLVETVDGTDRFDGNAAPHLHFVCDSCGDVLDVLDVPAMNTINEQVEAQIGARVTSTLFHGKCGKCVAKAD